MMAAIQSAKKDLRKGMRDILQKVPQESIASQSRITCTKLMSLPEYKQAQRIGVYLSMPSGELSTKSIVQDAFSHGKEVFVPYIHPVEPSSSSSSRSSSTEQRTSVMDMLELRSFEEYEQLTPDKWGIPSLQASQIPGRRNCLGGTGVSTAAEQPSGPRDPTDTRGLDLIVMPGMAFDYGFRRLGHGKGYYDHFLTRYFTSMGQSSEARIPQMPLLVALALKEQLVIPPKEVPVLDHDWLVDIVIVGDNQFLIR